VDPNSATETIDFDESLASGLQLLAPGTVLAGRYEVRQFLGSGGYAAVYRAFDRELRCEIALKVLRHDRTSPSAIARLRREVSVARSAADAHLVRVFDLASDGDTTFLTMELIRGQSLRRTVTSTR
jgi:serine/threonine-protein kinase